MHSPNPSPNTTIPLKTIWTELWARALREPLGVIVRVTSPESAKYNLARARPAGLSGWSICTTSQKDLLIIAGPDVKPSDEHRAHALSQIRADLQEPLP